MKEAIELAVKGGYDIEKYFGVELSRRLSVPKNVTKEWLLAQDDCVFIDPIFWKSLGKACGWGKNKTAYGEIIWNPNGTVMQQWQEVWHRFIDHLAEGKKADSFFTNLLS